MNSPDYLYSVSKQELLDALELYIERLDELPDHVKYEPVSNADQAAALRMIYEILSMKD